MADINTDQRYDNVSLAITNSRGDPASVDGVPVWASSDETVLSVAPANDGMSASVDTVGPGTARISVTADADLGAGTHTITGVSEEVNVTLGPSSQASNFTFTFGTPVAKNP
jgi:hypothetical protein